MRMPTLMIPCAVFAMPVLGDLPAALDRVPTNAAAVIGIQSLESFHSDISGIADLFQIEDLGGPLEMAQMLLSTPGLNASGSAALVIMPGEDGFVDVSGPEPTMFAILPVASYDEMVGAFGGDAAAAVTELSMDGDVVFATNLGGGFCAIAPEAANLRGVGEVRGAAPAHATHVGMSGQRVIESSDLFVALDIKAFTPAIEQAMGEMRQSMAMVQTLMGEQGAGMGQMVDMVDGLSTMLTEDGQAAVLGINVNSSGVSLDASAQFREGSQIASMAAKGGNASSLLDRVPDMPFIAAFAVDMSSPQLKEWMAEMSEAAMAMQPGDANPFGFVKTGELMELVDGSAFVMGNPPSLLMGGIFHSMMEFKASSDSQKLLAATREMLPKMDGMSQQGITFNATLDAGVKQVAGTMVDTWSMKMAPDPENPAAQRMAMMFSMIFGPNQGPHGYYAPVEGGLITTMALNDDLLARAIKAANAGHGLASGEKVSTAIASQPEGAIVQGFLDVGVLGKQLMSMAAMMGPGAPQLEIPENLAPIGVSLATGSGGLHGRVHVPQGILNMISAMSRQMADEMGGGEGGGPRF